MKKIMLITLLLFSILSANSQTITLQECQELAQRNFPLVRQQNLIEQTAKNSSSAILSRYFPQVQVNAQATYQSDVTKIELGNLPTQMQSISFPTPDKHQYKAYIDVSQVLYDGGAITAQRKLVDANSRVEKEKVAVELYKLKDRINQTYFGILLMDEQLKQTDLLQNDLQTALDKVNVMVKNGVSLISNKQNLEAEMLKLKQNQQEIQTNRQSLIQVLALLTGKEITENTSFAKPQSQIAEDVVQRPELFLINSQLNTLKLQNNQLNTIILPKVNLFFQGGYGKPALNMFKNEFEPYYVTGVRLNWQLSGFYTLGKDKDNLKVQQKSLEVQRDIFNLNQQIAEKQQNSEMQKLRDKLKSDDEIINLRSEIKKSSSVQLENGVLTSSDFIRDANAENQARQTKSLHEIQILLAEYNLRWIAP